MRASSCARVRTCGHFSARPVTNQSMAAGSQQRRFCLRSPVYSGGDSVDVPLYMAVFRPNVCVSASG